MEINGSKIRVIYRATTWTRKEPVRLFVTMDGRIWIGYGHDPERYSHIGHVGGRNTEGTGRAAIRRAANS